MNEPTASALSRRRLLAGAAAGASALCLPPLLAGCTAPGPEPRVASPGFLDTLADIVVPATDTPGAKAVGAGRFMDRAFKHGLFGGDSSTAGLLEAILSNRVPNGNFMRAAPRAQAAAVAALDKETFSRAAAPVVPSAAQVGTATAKNVQYPAEPEQNRLWRVAKNAVMVGYYMSEAGASQELRYELVPGRFDPDVPVGPGDTYLSNNWIANLG